MVIAVTQSEVFQLVLHVRNLSMFYNDTVTVITM